MVCNGLSQCSARTPPHTVRTQEPRSVILYEYPFNERLRTYLRLEQLFRRLGELIARPHPLDHHYALVTMFEVMDVAARADLKADVLKDLEKHKHQLDAYRGNPSISEEALDGVIAQLDQCFAALNAQTGKAGQALTENDWLMSIRSRVGIPGAPAALICPPTTRGSTVRPRTTSTTCTTGPPRWGRWQSPSTCCCACCVIRGCRRKWRPSAGSSSRTCPRAAPSSCCAWR